MAEKQKINGRKVSRGIIRDGDYIYVRLANNGEIFKRLIGRVDERDVLRNAEEKLAYFRKLRRNNKLGIEGEEIRIGIDQVCDTFWEKHGSIKRSPCGVKITLRKLRVAWAGRYWDSITDKDIIKYRQDQEATLALSSVNREHEIIRTMFNKMKEWRKKKEIVNVKLPEENPAALVKVEDEEHLRRKRVVSPEEFDRFWKSATIRVRRICLAALHSLLRKEDLMALTIDELDQVSMVMVGRQAKTGKAYKVPINEVMQRIIETATSRKILDFTNWTREFKAARAKSGVFFQLRDLRRTGARMMLKNGIDIGTVSRYLGHATIEMTIAYVQPDEKDLVIAGNKIGGLYPIPEKQKVSEKVSYNSEIMEPVAA